MTTKFSGVVMLSDGALLAQVTALAAREREATVELIASLAELDARRLYLGAGCSSLFTYCTQILHLSEHAAYGRIEAARAARRYPVILSELAEGKLTLTAVCLLAPVLTGDNHRDLLDAASHRSKREVEQLVARVRPQPAGPPIVRKLPTPRAAETLGGPSMDVRQTTGEELEKSPALQAVSAASMPVPGPSPDRPAIVRSLAPERYKVQFTVSRETHDKLRRAQDLLRHTIPSGDPAAIFDRALTLLLDNLEKQKLGATARPRAVRPTSPGSRHVPATLRRQVWERDGGRCAFVGTTGRCAERGFVEFHHVVPFAAGGSTTLENLELRCRAHNAYEAERHFGWSLVREQSASYRITRSGPRPAINPHLAGRRQPRISIV